VKYACSYPDVGQPTAAALLAGTVARPTVGAVADPSKFLCLGVANAPVMSVYDIIKIAVFDFFSWV